LIPTSGLRNESHQGKSILWSVVSSPSTFSFPFSAKTPKQLICLKTSSSFFPSYPGAHQNTFLIPHPTVKGSKHLFTTPPPPTSFPLSSYGSHEGKYSLLQLCFFFCVTINSRRHQQLTPFLRLSRWTGRFLVDGSPPSYPADGYDPPFSLVLFLVNKIFTSRVSFFPPRFRVLSTSKAFPQDVGISSLHAFSSYSSALPF